MSILTEPIFHQNIFSKLSIGLMDVHPVKPWLLFSEKKNQTIYLYDYQEKTILYQFSLDSIYNQKKQEIILIKLLEKSYNNITLPEYDDQLIKMDKVGELRGIRLYDSDIIHWKISENEIFKKTNTTSKVSKKMSFAGSIAAQQNYKSKVTGEKQRLVKRLIYNPRRDPRCILIWTDTRLVILKYDEDTTSFVFDEVKNSQLDGKNIVSIEFLYTQPLIAIGCSDGVVRFYNYSIRSMLERKIVAHSKSLIKMIVILREDPVNNYPSLLTCGMDGSMCLWNIDKLVAEYKIAKPFDNAPQQIVDIYYDATSMIITLIGSERNICTRRMATGNLIKNVKMNEKTPMKELSIVNTCNPVPQFYLLNGQSNRIYLASCLLDSENVLSFDLSRIVPQWSKIKPKTQIMMTHPLKTNLFFIGTSNGICLFTMDSRLPMACSAFYIPMGDEVKDENTTNEPEKEEVKVLGFDLEKDIPTIAINLPKTVEKAIYYVVGQSLMKRVALSSQYANEKKLRELNRVGNTVLSASTSGKYLSVFWENEKEFEIYSCDTWRCIATGSKVKGLAWGIHADTIAVAKTDVNKLGIYWAVNQTLKPIAEYEAPSTIKSVFTGNLLGIGYENDTFEFINWDGSPMKDLSPLSCPLIVKWDRLTSKCVIVYSDSYAIFSYVPKFEMEIYIKETIAEAMWWNGTLFVATNLDIKALFPIGKHLDYVVLASWDLVRYGSLPENELDDSLDPIPQQRPKGVLSMMDVVGDSLMLIDCKAQLHKISIAPPSIRFRMLVQATKVQQALGWLPLISEELYDKLSDFLNMRGFHQEASTMENLTPQVKIQNCINAGQLEMALETLSQVDLSHKEMSNFYILLGSRAQTENLVIAEEAFKKATEIKSSLYNHLVTFYAKFGMWTELESLQDSAIKEGNYQCASMCSLFLQRYQECSDYSKLANDFSLAALMNSKHNLSNQTELVQDWQNGLKAKYKNIPSVLLN